MTPFGVMSYGKPPAPACRSRSRGCPARTASLAHAAAVGLTGEALQLPVTIFLGKGRTFYWRWRGTTVYSIRRCPVCVLPDSVSGRRQRRKSCQLGSVQPSLSRQLRGSVLHPRSAQAAAEPAPINNQPLAGWVRALPHQPRGRGEVVRAPSPASARRQQAGPSRCSVQLFHLLLTPDLTGLSLVLLYAYIKPVKI